jgi:GNAT superfamily N-acetyltransferase
MHDSLDSLEIAAAREVDVPLILSFIRALAEYEKLSAAVVASEELLRSHLFGPQRAAEVLIASVGGEPAGFALFFSTFSTFLGKPGVWLEDLFVLPAFRRRGVGSRLLGAVAGIAVERGCGRLEWAVLDWNQPAIDLYRRRGASMLEDWRICRVDGDRLIELAGVATRNGWEP